MLIVGTSVSGTDPGFMGRGFSSAHIFYAKKERNSTNFLHKINILKLYSSNP